MIPPLPPYPAYKDSGLPWLGQVPAHWRLARIKNVFRESDIRSKDGRGTLLSLTRARGLLPQSEASNRVASAEDLSSYKVCKPGQLVMNRMQAWSGMFATSKVHGLVSPDYAVFDVTSPTETDYFANLFRTPLYVGQFNLFSKGIGSGFNRLYTPDFGNIALAIPPQPEQHAIVRFLDHVDRRIARYIRAKQRLIALLTEQKQAIINHAVTRGLDPTVPLKPSGVDWLGDIPAHWEVRRLKTIARIRYGLGQPPRELLGGLPLVRATNIERGRIVEKDFMYVDPEDVPQNRGAILGEGEILVVRSGAYTADSAIVTEAYVGAVAGYDMVLSVDSAEPKFIALVLLSAYVLRDQLYLLRSRAAQPHLNAEELGSILITLPPIEEQQTLIRVVSSESASLDQAITRARRQIDLIREYRTRLIADVVTGKLDVRGVTLPDEPAADDDVLPEPIAEDEAVNEMAVEEMA